MLLIISYDRFSTQCPGSRDTSKVHIHIRLNNQAQNTCDGIGIGCEVSICENLNTKFLTKCNAERVELDRKAQTPVSL